MLIIALAVSAGGWWAYGKWFAPPPEPIDVLAGDPKPLLISDRPADPDEVNPQPEIPEKGGDPDAEARRREIPGERAAPAGRANDLVEAGKQALESGDLLAAREHFSDALEHDFPEAQRNLLRAELTRLGNETIFSQRVIPSDPFVSRYTIQAGDTLGKIAKANKVPVDLLAAVNGIRNPNLIRVGQSIKAIHGPFHAVVETDALTMGIYLGNTFVKKFPVGLGLDNSTPRGLWRVTTKLKNPTYYPPRGGAIVAADDPENPLGERWIGLEGIEGEAVGQLRYGIHGTNEPETIGKSESLGCVRLHNEDVEKVYSYLIERDSTVRIK